MTRICLIYLIVFTGLVFMGCKPQQPSVEVAAAPPTPAVAAPVAPVSTTLGTWADVEQIVQQSAGKVVVVDVWSTWCVPCVKEFPGLVKLHKQHSDQVVCVSLNCNYAGSPTEPPESARPEVEAFLKKQDATFANLICTEPDEQLFKTLGAAAIPVVRVYDKQGKLRQQFDNDEGEYGEEGFRYDQHIAPLVEQLLKE